MHCRAHIKFGLHIHNMGETDVDTLRFGKMVLKKDCESVGWCPTGV